jgi:hypothetical protein
MAAAAAASGHDTPSGMGLRQLYALLYTLKTHEDKAPVVKAIGEREAMVRDCAKTDDDKLDAVRLAQAVCDKLRVRTACNGWPRHTAATLVLNSDYLKFSGLRDDTAYAEFGGKKLVALLAPAADRAWMVNATLEQVTEVCDLKWDQKTVPNKWGAYSDLYVITKLK